MMGNIFKGMLSSTSDLSLATQCAMSGWKILYVGDPCGAENIIRQYQFIMAMPLVPEYQILCKEIDGAIAEFDLEYEDQLMRNDASDFFAGILTAMLTGINVMLFFPEETSQLRYPTVLMGYIYNTFGIIAANMNIRYTYNDDYNANNLVFMYTKNTIDTKTFLLFFDYPLVPELVDRIIFDIKPFLRNPSDYNEKIATVQDYRMRLLGFAKVGIEPIDVITHEYNYNPFEVGV